MRTNAQYDSHDLTMKRRVYVLIGIAVLVAQFPLGIHADTLFSNLGQTTNAFFGANIDNTNYRLATDFFTGSSATVVTNGTLRLENSDNIPHHYTLSLLSDNGSGNPGSLVGSFNISFVTNFANPSVSNSFTSSGITLLPDSSYWAVLQMDEPITNSDSWWSGLGSQATDPGSVFLTIPGTQIERSTDAGATWNSLQNGNFWFSLSGTVVPEPSTAAILVMGLLGHQRARKTRRGKRKTSARLSKPF